MFVILKQRDDTVKAETDASIDNAGDVIGRETDEVCVPQECVPEASHILTYIFVCGFAHMELLKLVDLQSCLSGALHLLQC